MPAIVENEYIRVLIEDGLTGPMNHPIKGRVGVGDISHVEVGNDYRWNVDIVEYRRGNQDFRDVINSKTLSEIRPMSKGAKLMLIMLIISQSLLFVRTKILLF